MKYKLSKKIDDKSIINVKITDEDGYFSITGDIVVSESCDRCGCIHDEIKKHFPELKPFIKWHLFNKDTGPIHYIANTLYFSRDREDMSKDVGEPIKFDEYLKFDKYPFHFEEQSKGFWNYLNSVDDFNKIDIKKIKHSDRNEDYFCNYSLEGFLDSCDPYKWSNAPFSNELQAKDFLNALRDSRFSIVKIPTKFNKALEPEIDKAREHAIWKDASLDQLQSEEELEEHLIELKKKYKEDMEKLKELMNKDKCPKCGNDIEEYIDEDGNIVYKCIDNFYDPDTQSIECDWIGLR